jgi:hypothetical protein
VAVDNSRRVIELRTVIAIGVLLAVLAIGAWVYLEQRAVHDRQLQGIELSTDCLIAGGHVVEQRGNQVCVDASGRVLDLPPP